MKIVFVSQPLSTGGAERVVAVLANRFHEMGNEVKIVVVDNGDQNVYYTHPEIEFIHIAKPSNPVLDLLYRAHKMRAFFREYRPDVILPFTTQKNVSTLLATLFSSHKVIVSERSNPYFDPANKVLRMLRKLLYFTADGFVFQTDGAKDYFSKDIQMRSCVIANPINDKIPDIWQGEREHRIVMVNRLETSKNITMAIDAFAELCTTYNDYKMEIYGKGPLEEELDTYIQESGMTDKVSLKGFCVDVNDRIKNAEIFLMTSNYEGMSNSLMEAMAMGLVCVSTDHPTGGAKALIESGVNGFLFPVQNTAECIKALKSVLDMKKKAREISANAVKIRDELSINNIADLWLGYINLVISR